MSLNTSLNTSLAYALSPDPREIAHDFAEPTPSAGAVNKSDRRLPPAIDLVHLSRQTMGDRALETELLQMFAAQAAHIVERLQADLTGTLHADHAKLCGDLAHKLKGSARAIGAVDVAAGAQALEEALTAGTGVIEALQVLVARVKQAEAHIAGLLGPA